MIKKGISYGVVDIEVDARLSVYESHKISHQVEKNLRKTVKSIYEVVIHVEPAGYRNRWKILRVKKKYPFVFFPTKKESQHC